MSITLPAEPRARLPSPPTEGQHSGHGLGSQRSRLGSASRSASAGRKNPRWKQLRASSLLGERQRSGAEGERQLLPDNSSTSWEPGGAGRGRQEPEGSGEHRAPSRPRSGEPGRDGEAAAGGVPLCATGGSGAGASSPTPYFSSLLVGTQRVMAPGSRRDARAPLPTPPFSHRGTGKVSPGRGVMWCGRSQPGPPPLSVPSLRPAAGPMDANHGKGSTQRQRPPCAAFIPGASPPIPLCVPGAAGCVPRASPPLPGCVPGTPGCALPGSFWLRPPRRCGFKTKWVFCECLIVGARWGFGGCHAGAAQAEVGL